MRNSYRAYLLLLAAATVLACQALAVRFLHSNPLEMLGSLSNSFPAAAWAVAAILLAVAIALRPRAAAAPEEAALPCASPPPAEPSPIEQLRLVRRDPLTNLANLRMFDETTTRDLAAGQQVVMLMIDLDRFHEINDKFGIRAGDLVLQEAADRLRSTIATHHTLARVFSDRFGILCIGQSAVEEAESFAAILPQLFETPFFVAAQNIVIPLSIGIARSPKDGTDATTLMRAATSALHAVKLAGGGRWRHYSAETEDEDAELRRDLRLAIGGNQIKPFYQPIIDFSSNQMVGLEVLARWDHPVLGVISPDRFIGIAEKESMLSEMTARLLAQVAQDSTAWPVGLFFSFNVAASQLAEFVAYAIQQKEWIVSHLPANRIEIELNEYTLITNFEMIREAVQQLHEYGSRVVLDDFGAGYTNFRHLRGIAFDRLKIDRELVLDMIVDPRAEVCVRSIADLGRVLGIDVVAKGISSTEIENKAREFGCGFGQGSLYAMPVAADAVAELVTKINSAKPRDPNWRAA